MCIVSCHVESPEGESISGYPISPSCDNIPDVVVLDQSFLFVRVDLVLQLLYRFGFQLLPTAFLPALSW